MTRPLSTGIFSLILGAWSFSSPAMANITTAERLMGDLQGSLGLTREQAAGVVGNLSYESGNFRTLQEGAPMVPGSRGGYGFAQWTADRRVNFESYAASRGLPIDGYEANRDFLIHEFSTSHRNDLEAILATTTTQEAADAMMREFLVPHPPTAHFDRRLGLSEAFAAGDFSGSAFPVAGSVYGSGFAGYEPPASPIDIYTPVALMPWISVQMMGAVPVGRAY